MSLDYKACFKPVNGPPKTFQDAMDPFETRKLSKDAHSKSPYTKAGPLLGSQCPDLISRATFRSHPTVPFIIQQSCVLMCPGQRGPFRIQCSVLILDTME
ncbi:hypothetical protein TNCT_404361 [Trichonephila clavata]|uniref:Uncharacterized protein n=1 Tax=Trichonephila clavata TaxID=2740835 RepID=A0A8X6J5D4_TRICU|nr:hypothetical protein TNCT_404361 [Trichonephila clavata]